MGDADMLPRPALSQLLRDAQADLHDYAALAALLEQQFTSALLHEAAKLITLAEEITTLTDRLEQRRCTRVTLVTQLLNTDKNPSMTALLPRLPSAMRAPIAALWTRLTAAVEHCKQLNLRNARLMTEQQALLQRVLQGDKEELYADV